MAKTLGGKKGKGGMITDINVTPFVDVTLVLLIIFMVTATYIARGSLRVKLPEASSAGEMSRSPLILSVNDKGEYLLESKLATEPQVIAYIEEAVRKNPEVEAVISGDKEVEYGKVMTLINLARKHGVRNFAAAVERRNGP